MAVSQGMIFLSSCAPFFTGLMNGPSMFTPTRSAPFGFCSFLYSAAVLKISSSSSTGSVIVAGAIVVTPTEASYFAIFSIASLLLSQKSSPIHPWKCRSISPGIAYAPCPSTTSSPSISGTFSVV